MSQYLLPGCYRFSWISGLDSDRSFARFTLQDKNVKLAFGKEADKLFAISYEGNYYLVNTAQKSKFIEEKKTFLNDTP